MLVNWQVVNRRFRALMWVVAAAIALVIAISALPQETNTHPSPRTWNTLHGKGKP